MRRGLGFLSLAPLLCVAKGLRRLAIVNYSGSSQVLVSTCGVRVGSPALMRAMWHAHGPGPRCGLYVQIAGPAVPSVLAAEAAYSGLTGPGRDPFFVQHYATRWKVVECQDAASQAPAPSIGPRDWVCFYRNMSWEGVGHLQCHCINLLHDALGNHGPFSSDICNGAVRGRGFSPYGPNREPIPLSLRPTLGVLQRCSAAVASYPVCREHRGSSPNDV